MGALGSRCTRIPLVGATLVCCLSLATTSFSDALTVSSDLENPDEMNLAVLTVLPTLLPAQMLTLSQRMLICFEI